MFVNVLVEGGASLMRVEEVECEVSDLKTEEGEVVLRCEEGESEKADWADERGAGERSRTVLSFGDGGRGICSGGGVIGTES